MLTSNSGSQQVRRAARACSLISSRCASERVAPVSLSSAGVPACGSSAAAPGGAGYPRSGCGPVVGREMRSGLSLMLPPRPLRPSFRLARLVLTPRGGPEGVPGQGGAFHADRVLRDVLERDEFAEPLRLRFRVEPAREQVMKRGEQGLGFGARLALEQLGHDGGGCRGNGAALALEADVLDHVAVELQVDGEPVAAQVVVPFEVAAPPAQGAEVARPLAVLEDQVVVQLAQVGHQPNTSLTLWSPRTRASISSRVL